MLIEFDVAWFECEEGMIPTDTYLLAGKELRTALTDEDLAGIDVFV